jgi:micrococcal nuclease
MEVRADLIWRRIARLTAIAVAVVVIVSIVWRTYVADGDDQNGSSRFLVVEIKDGDTVILNGGDQLRLANVDAPERGEPFYDEAIQKLSELCLGREVRLEFSGSRRDKYDRLVASCYVDSIFLGEALVRSGLAYVFLFEKSDFERPEIQKLLVAQQAAVAERVGMHSLTRTAEDYYPGLRGRFRFHRPGCRSLAKSNPDRIERFPDREQPLEMGLSPCRRCRP